MSFDDDALDFEIDLTDLETFGESTSVKTTKVPKDAVAKSVAGLPSGTSQKSDNTSRSSQEELEPSPPVKQRRLDSDPASEEAPAECRGDSDEEKLVIDDSPSPPASQPVTATAQASPQAASRPGRRSQRTKATGDQLSEILRMQSAMFSTTQEAPKRPVVADATSPSKAPPPARSHQTSLVKPCVSSYLERHKVEEACSVSRGAPPAVNIAAADGKSECQDFILSP